MTDKDHNQEATESTEPKPTDASPSESGCGTKAECAPAKAEASSCSCPEDCARMVKKYQRPLALAAGVALLAGLAWLGRRKLAKGGCPCAR